MFIEIFLFFENGGTSPKSSEHAYLHWQALRVRMGWQALRVRNPEGGHNDIYNITGSRTGKHNGKTKWETTEKNEKWKK